MTALDLAQPAVTEVKQAAPSSQWRLFYGIMGYNLAVTLLVSWVSASLWGMSLPALYYPTAALVGLLLIGFVNYVIVKWTLRRFLFSFLSRFNSLVDQPLPKPANPLRSTELDNIDELFDTLSRQLATYISNTVNQQTLLQRLQRYFPPQVAERLAEEGDALEQTAEINVTVMFADLRGFTRNSSRMEPREVVAMLNEYFSVMIDIIQDGGGTVLKLIGDGIMAVFGAPVAQTDDAGRAVEVARRMHAAYPELVRRWAALGLHPDTGLGIGLNRGHVVVGNIGSPHHLDYTVIGDTVNLASRLSDGSISKGGETIISASVVEALNGAAATLEPRDPVRVKGKEDQPQAVFCLR
jgi:class 3 adenylate cyclase